MKPKWPLIYFSWLLHKLYIERSSKRLRDVTDNHAIRVQVPVAQQYHRSHPMLLEVGMELGRWPWGCRITVHYDGLISRRRWFDSTHPYTWRFTCAGLVKQYLQLYLAKKNNLISDSDKIPPPKFLVELKSYFLIRQKLWIFSLIG